MSDKELAHSLIEELPAEYLEQAIVMLAKLTRIQKNPENCEKRRKSFEELEGMLKPAPPDFDPEKEREEYYKEKYGI